ncbi:hypothetical protein BKA67DRAFT_655365 [Truncatella angustata]|uniref:Xylanolytic transcriptional activator regulatory domain-containing protein n=1 Tax=Truncatella angustata TaxID=152316 RepID=A0A9P8URE2_9PEZI|nr:uncharacterized protein BKA67DRAFT_655365 [Truncatella angustata]KAH6657072.1 hypothetical protein BKA67DRAFT_655365 [Truncatella angustata]
MTSVMDEPERRRRRPAVRRKIKCNREKPCNNCLKSDPRNCIYETQSSQPTRPRVARPSENGGCHLQGSSSTGKSLEIQNFPSSSQGDASSKATAGGGVPPAWYVDSIKGKTSQLERQLSQAGTTPAPQSATPSASTIEANSSSLGGTWFVLREQGVRPIVRSVTHKTRHFGQSHWINNVTLLKDLMVLIEPLLREGTYPVLPNLQKAKSLSKAIKANWRPAWPTSITSELPSKELSDVLVDRYLRTLESVHRIVHVPSFKRDYGALWVSEDKPDPSFLVLLKLILAIGAATYDDHFSLRISATRWVYEAQTWIAQPNTKHQLTLQGLQVHILLLFAREIVDVSGDSVYIATGDLFRRAIVMGLNRDPVHLPHKSHLVAEMRRRIWNTVLELCIQSSLTSGGPPLFSFDDFDTEPPSNLDDDQLGGTDEPIPKPLAQFTEVSLALSLRKILPIRLAITKSLNNLRSACTYEETLQLDAELRKGYKDITRVLQSFRSRLEPGTSGFGFQAVDFVMQRYMAALHIPFFGPSLEQAAFAFSRKVVIDASLKIWYLVRPTLQGLNGSHINGTNPSNSEDFSRIAACGAGMFRLAATQAGILIAAELKTQLQENDSLGPAPVRPDLLAVLRDAQSWSLHCIKSGECNIKGYLMSCMIMALVDGLIRNASSEELPHLLIKAAVKSQDTTIPILEQFARQSQSEGTAEVHHVSYSTPSDADWDLIMADTLLNGGNTDSINWMIDDGAIPGASFW